ncbi:MAG: TonB-dependent receptor [Candidatus Marinimicrobia bacterium]|nr:TonB-dependent receptor [Candidatus Neomarinimicrobiota bacterium]
MKITARSFFFLCIFFSVNMSSFATNFITGRIISENRKSPIAHANVFISETGEGTISGSDGRFRLSVKQLPCELRVCHIAFEPKVVYVKNLNLGEIFLIPAVLTGEEVLATVSRAVPGKTPVAFTMLEKSDIDNAYFQQDVPMVLNDLPGVFSYSDAGNGIGYSYLKIRGFQQDRIGVMVNGIPMNDPESHAVYWVDHGDVLSSTGDIQVQRGVGNSLYGTSVFGGTVNLATNYLALDTGLVAETGYGNYTQKGLHLPSTKASLSYCGRPWKDQNFIVYSRISRLQSAGYRDGSGAEQTSIHAGIEKNGKDRMTRIEAMSGDETTAFSWEGVAPVYGFDLDNGKDRRYNFYADPDYNGGFDNLNQDVFRQTLLSFQHSRKIGDNLINLTAYRIFGKGYYQQFKGDVDAEEYNLTEQTIADSESIDLLRRKWLENGYWGIISHLNHRFAFGELTVGGDIRFYNSEHYGKVAEIYSPSLLSLGNRNYYSDESQKISGALYAHALVDLAKNLTLMVDLRYLGHRYFFNQDTLGAFVNGYEYGLSYNFIDPHLGLNWKIGKGGNAFINYSTAHREPGDGDFYDHDDPDDYPKVKFSSKRFDSPLLKTEFLTDFELGTAFSSDKWSAQINLYRMDFRNELIPVEYRYTDADEVYHANADQTIHQGVEATVSSQINSWLKIDGNLTYADNRLISFHADSIGWSGWGGIADFHDCVLPGFPAFQIKGKVMGRYKFIESWMQILHIGKQYIDFANTESAAIPSYQVVNFGTRIELPEYRRLNWTLTFRINNVFDVLYETFGYNYYEMWGDERQRIDLYWPAATRNYYLTLTVQFD